MIKPNKVGIFFIGLFILIAGCENDPLELTPSNGQTLTRTVFTLGTESEAVQDSVIIGSSKRLYAGHTEDILSTILLSLDYNNIQEHPICLYLYEPDSLQDIENIQFEFKSLQPLMDSDSNLFVDTAALTIGLSSAEIWNEEVNIYTPEFLQIEWNIETVLDSINITENSLQITIVDPLKLSEWCSSQSQYLIIKYEPELNTLLENELKLLEFYSSEFSISHRPQISFDYSELKATSKSTNKFLIKDITSELEEETSVHIVNNIESEAWSRIYLLNIDDDLETHLDSSIVTYDLSYNETPIIDSEMLNQQVNVLKLTIELNDEIIDSIDTFGLSILDNSVIAYSKSINLSGDYIDLSGDNYSSANILGTEGNSMFDQGEEFLDFGFDQCPDEYEDGNDNCLVLLPEFDSTQFNCVASDDIEVDINCIYNSVGTEGNDVLDWEDAVEGEENSNGIWNDGEGEKWEDVGNDGCADEFEVGDEACSETQNVDYVEGSDPNGDNYNIDPAEDDYDELENPTGTENNGIWEEGEPFFDIGCDGIPQIIDEFQNNGIYDDCEPFNDTGIDGIYTGLDENGSYPYNPLGTEGNLSYDGGSEPFNDFGVDNIEDGIDGDDPSDNFNIDPNGDNELEDGNDIYDEGEHFDDYGSDGVINTDEVFSESNFLNVGTGNDEGLNDYTIDKDMVVANTYPIPDLSTDDIMLWISKINPTVGANQFELTFSVYAVKEVKSLSFSLTHTKSDRVKFVSESFSSNDYTAKFVDDISVYGINDFENETQLSLNYGHGITSKIDFINSETNISLSDFIDDNRNALLSNAYTQLVFPIDEENSTIDEFGANLILYGIISEELQPLISINISQNDERIIIPMSTLLQKYLNGQYLNYNGFELTLDGTKYNFSNIVLQNSAYLEIVHSK